MLLSKMLSTTNWKSGKHCTLVKKIRFDKIRVPFVEIRIPYYKIG